MTALELVHWCRQVHRLGNSSSVTSAELNRSRCSGNKCIWYFWVLYCAPVILPLSILWNGSGLSIYWPWYIHILTMYIIFLVNLSTRPWTHVNYHTCKLAITCFNIYLLRDCCMKHKPIFWLFWTWLLFSFMYWKKLLTVNTTHNFEYFCQIPPNSSLFSVIRLSLLNCTPFNFSTWTKHRNGWLKRHC